MRFPVPRTLLLGAVLLGPLAPAGPTTRATGAAPPSAPAPVPVAEVRGALVLAGGGKLPDAVRLRFLDLAGGAKARLVVIPTASARADGPDAALALDAWKKAGAASVVLLHTRDRAKADSDAFVKPLAAATGAWIEGGDQAHLTAAYRGTAVQRELRRLLDRGGVVGGTSAGAAVLGDLTILGGAKSARVGPGLGLLPGVVVDQHFLARDRVERLLDVLKRHPTQAGLGIDEGTAVVVRGRRIAVVGGSCAVLCLAPSRAKPARVQALKVGGVADLFSLRRAALARAAAPFPPEKPEAPEVKRGALMIGGGGGMALSIWKRFIDLAGGPGALIVVVPTALEGPIATKPGEVRALEKAGARNVVLLHTRDRAEANDPKFVAPLLKAKGVWFSGGRQWRFVDAYEGTATERGFHAVLKRGGVIGGSSAGASIQSEYMPRGDPLGNRVVMAEGYERGFGFLKGAAVDQHFFARKRERDMTALMKAYPQLLGIGIDEGTVVLVRGTVLEVIGRSRVAVYDRRKPAPEEGPDYEELRAGDKYDLKARRRVEER